MNINIFIEENLTQESLASILLDIAKELITNKDLESKTLQDGSIPISTGFGMAYISHEFTEVFEG